MHWSSASSDRADSGQALGEVVAELEARLHEAGVAEAPDLLLLFATAHHNEAADAIRGSLARIWPQAVLVGCTGGGVIGGSRELEQRPGLCLTAATLPDVRLEVLPLAPGEGPAPGSPPQTWQALLDVVPEQLPAFLVLADPYTCDGAGLAAVLDQAFPGCPKLGGLASGGAGPGQHVLWAGERVLHAGAVVLSMFGDIELVPIVAQGVRPVGRPLRITRAERNYVLQIEERRAIDVFQELFAALPPDERQRFRAGPVVGVSVDEDNAGSRLPGPHDWLVRNLLGMDPEHGVIGVGGPVHSGQYLRFMIRDADAAGEELRELLVQHAHQPGTQPFQGALLFSCLGRGRAFFGEPEHDTRTVQRHLGPVSVGGFFCNGELGPVRGRTFLHGYTASLALFRGRSWD